jgi:hypothetical protein
MKVLIDGIGHANQLKNPLPKNVSMKSIPGFSRLWNLEQVAFEAEPLRKSFRLPNGDIPILTGHYLRHLAHHI